MYLQVSSKSLKSIVDLGIGKMEDKWFGDRGNLTAVEWAKAFRHKSFKVLTD